MFLDEHQFFSGPRPIEPARPEFRHEKAVSRIVLGFMLFLLLAPISFESFADLIQYCTG